ncbi:MAG: trypsin-like peptidase domain-containing protein, partial [Gemmatimonadota bacterium]|nr:trypsin-like peptidase domain-containing protein [Gemmatimonadota bacterium]
AKDTEPPSAERIMTPREISETYTAATVQILTESGSGTGVIVDVDEGIVVTNAHVITGAGTLKVGLVDGEVVAARVLGSAPCEDLAVLQLNEVSDSLVEVKIGSSQELASQEVVTAIGFPLSFDISSTRDAVTSSGAVQAPDVEAEPDSALPYYRSLIQHDATINPGSSGGPLFNEKGELVGINALANTSLGDRVIQDQFYAISIDRSMQFIDRLRDGESISDIGLSGFAFSEADISTAYENGDEIQETMLDEDMDGLIVDAVTINSPADKASIFEADFIYAVNDVDVYNFADLCEVLDSASGSVLVEGLYLDKTDNHELFDAWSTEVFLDD